VSWCPLPLFRPLGLVISYVVINAGLLFISPFIALCVKLDPSTHNGNAFSFSLKTGCDKNPFQFLPISILGFSVVVTILWVSGVLPLLSGRYRKVIRIQ
jgi:hypothetical protein